MLVSLGPLAGGPLPGQQMLASELGQNWVKPIIGGALKNGHPLLHAAVSVVLVANLVKRTGFEEEIGGVKIRRTEVHCISGSHRTICILLCYES